MVEALHAMYIPQPDAVASSQLTNFIRYCEGSTGQSFPHYRGFERFAIENFRHFWRLFVAWSDLPIEGEPEPVCIGDECETAKFFPHLRLNYAEALLARSSDEGRVAVTARSGTRREQLTFGQLRDRVARLATGLRMLGVGPDDRVVAVVRNNEDAVVAALATAAVGAVFSSCAPDMGGFAVLSRFAQLEPKLMMAHVTPASHDTGVALPERIAEIVAGLPILAGVIALDDGPLPPIPVPLHRLSDVTAAAGSGAVPWQRFPFNQPLFAMFSSGTTGVPKSILHGAGGTLIEHHKEHRLHCDLRRGDKLFFQTNCAWMMWHWQL